MGIVLTGDNRAILPQVTCVLLTACHDVGYNPIAITISFKKCHGLLEHLRFL